MTENAPNPKPANEPEIVVVNGTPTTTSQAIAQHFGKLHKNVLRAIDNVRKQIESERRLNLEPMSDGHELTSEDTSQRLLNFEETLIEVIQPNGGTRSERGFRVTRDGFAMLAMGFTGAKAMRFKWAYIEAFNRMAKQLADEAAGQGGDTAPKEPARRRQRRTFALPGSAPALSPDLQSQVNHRSYVISAEAMERIRAWLTDEVRRNCIDDRGRVKPNLANTLAAATFEDFASDWEAQRVNVQLGLLDYVVRELLQVRRGLRSRQRRSHPHH